MTYLFLATQADLTMCGAIPFRAARWAKRLGYAVRQLSEALALLADARFLVLDAEEEEVWLRTLIKHDGLLTKPNWLPSAKRAMAQVSSPVIRSAFAAEYPQLASEWGVDAIPHPIPHGIPDGMSKVEGIGDRGKGIDVTTPETVLSSTRVALVDEIAVAFEVFRERHPRSQLTADRRKLAAPYFKSHGAEYCTAGIRGIVYSPVHMGQNRSGTLYDTWEYVFKNVKNLEAFAGYELDPSTRPTGREPGRQDQELRRQIADGSMDLEVLEYAYGGPK
jgi:hypothetical protein